MDNPKNIECTQLKHENDKLKKKVEELYEKNQELRSVLITKQNTVEALKRDVKRSEAIISTLQSDTKKLQERLDRTRNKNASFTSSMKRDSTILDKNVSGVEEWKKRVKELESRVETMALTGRVALERLKDSIANSSGLSSESRMELLACVEQEKKNYVSDDEGNTPAECLSSDDYTNELLRLREDVQLQKENIAKLDAELKQSRMAEKAQEKRASHAIARLAFLTNNLKLTEPRVQQGSEESLSKNEEYKRTVVLLEKVIQDMKEELVEKELELAAQTHHITFLDRKVDVLAKANSQYIRQEKTSAEERQKALSVLQKQLADEKSKWKEEKQQLRDTIAKLMKKANSETKSRGSRQEREAAPLGRPTALQVDHRALHFER